MTTHSADMLADLKYARAVRSRGLHPYASCTLALVLAIVVSACHNEDASVPVQETICAESPPNGSTRVDDVSVTLPAGYTLSRSDKFDFITFSVRHEQREPLLFAYVGAHPSFPREKLRRFTEVHDAVQGLSRRRVSETVNGRVSRDALIQVPTRDEVLQVHFWYESLQAPEARAADSIIASLQCVR